MKCYLLGCNFLIIASAWWDNEEMTFVFAEKAEDFIHHNQDDHFFLFLSMHQNHVPRLPNPMHIIPLESHEYLFDLESDPGEVNNLAGDHPEQLKHMRELLDSVKYLF